MLPSPVFVWYYYICPREVWLLSRNLQPNHEHPFIEIGRLISEEAYPRAKKEIIFHTSKEEGGMILDLIKTEGGDVVVAEVKKSSSFEFASRMQLAYYLLRLKMLGIEAKGELLFPAERRKVDVVLTEEIEKELREAIDKINGIIESESPPEPKIIRFCKKCGYEELCWS